MKVWAVGVVVFFGLAELYQWFHSLSLPLPLYGVAGLLLALASNANRWSQLIWTPADPPRPQRVKSVPTPPVQTSDQPVQPSVNPLSPLAQPTVELPVSLRQPAQSGEPARSISFTIRKPQG
ncbi:MAG: hypothetical protein ACKO7W_12035 [Elainella sp.]